MLPWIPWWAWSLLSNVCVTAVECLNHGAGRGSSWIEVLPKTGPFILLMQYCLYRAWSGGDHLLMVWVVFALGNAIMRVAAVRLLFHTEIGSWPLITLGTALIVAGSYAINLGKMSPN
jgi:hypothetical protein